MNEVMNKPLSKILQNIDMNKTVSFVVYIRAAEGQISFLRTSNLPEVIQHLDLWWIRALEKLFK